MYTARQIISREVPEPKKIDWTCPLEVNLTRPCVRSTLLSSTRAREANVSVHQPWSETSPVRSVARCNHHSITEPHHAFTAPHDRTHRTCPILRPIAPAPSLSSAAPPRVRHRTRRSTPIAASRSYTTPFSFSKSTTISPLLPTCSLVCLCVSIFHSILQGSRLAH
jgi:hypothetical protein